MDHDLGRPVHWLTFCSASVATIARMAYIRGLKGKDFLWEVTDLSIWSVVEVGISIIATAATTLRPLLSQTRQFTISPALLINPLSLSGATVIGRRKWTGESKGVQSFDEIALSRQTIFWDEFASKKRDWLTFENEHGIAFSNPWSKNQLETDDHESPPMSPCEQDKDSDKDFGGMDLSEVARAY
jgi:hypothetical protein